MYTRNKKPLSYHQISFFLQIQQQPLSCIGGRFIRIELKVRPALFAAWFMFSFQPIPRLFIPYSSCISIKHKSLNPFTCTTLKKPCPAMAVIAFLFKHRTLSHHSSTLPASPLRTRPGLFLSRQNRKSLAKRSFT